MNIITIIIFSVAGLLVAVFINYKYNDIRFNDIYDTFKAIVKSIFKLEYDMHTTNLKIKYLFDKIGKEKEFQKYIDNDEEEMIEQIKSSGIYKDNKGIRKSINRIIKKKK